jgi:hypothetical protein
MRERFQTPVPYLLLAAASLGIAGIWGPDAVLGMFFGLIATTIGWFGWFVVLKLLTSDPERQRLTGVGTVIIFLMKLPIWVGLLFYVKSVSGVAANGFFAGTLVVYCGAITWAQTRKA